MLTNPDADARAAALELVSGGQAGEQPAHWVVGKKKKAALAAVAFAVGGPSDVRWERATWTQTARPR